MTAKFLRGLAALLVFVMAISAGAVVCRAQYDQSIPQLEPAAPAPKQAPKINKAEEDAYKALLAARSGAPQPCISAAWWPLA